MTSGIYGIYGPKEVPYIGSSKNIEQRWYHHKCNLRKNKHNSKKLQRAWNKYGESAFTFKIIKIVEDKTKLLLEEQKYLNLIFYYYLDNEHYNILQVARNRTGYKVSEEYKTKLSLRMKGNKYSLGRLNKSAKTYIFLSPSKQIVVIYNMKKFCSENNLSYSNMNHVANGKRKSCNKWTLFVTDVKGKEKS